MDYLYQEMTPEEAKAFETELADNPDLKQQLLAFEQTRSSLSLVEDKEVVAPSFVIETRGSARVSFFQSMAFQWVGSVAASLVLLLVMGYLFQFNLSRTTNGYQLGFGSDQNTHDEVVNKENVKAWMKEAMMETDQQTNVKLADLEQKLTNKMDSQDRKNYLNLEQMMVRHSNGTDQLMQQYVAQINNENRQMIESFFEVSSETQQEYMQSVLADFNEFYQNQRSHDLKVIETSIDLMKNNYDVQQLEQDNLLANLYDIMQTQSR